MTYPMILAPLFVLVLLTFALGFWLAVLRGPPLLRSGEIRPDRIVDCASRTGRRARLQVGNSFQNQFELPVLFYVLTILAIITKHADLLFVVMAWIFVLFAAGARLCPCHQQQPPRPRRVLRHRRVGAGDHVADLHRAYHARAAIMTPGARLAAAIEVLSDIGARRRPAADTLEGLGPVAPLRRLRRPRRHRRPGL